LLELYKYSTATLNKYISTFLQATCVARNDNPASFDPFSVEVNFFITFQFETQTRWPDLSDLRKGWFGLDELGQ
jgi:hypothetical protein